MRAEPAAIEEQEAAADAASTFLAFDLGGQRLGVSVERVREILDLQPMTRLPDAPHEVRGVIDVRGASVPILDLAARLGLDAAEAGPEARVIVFDLGEAGRPRAFGVLADRVRDVRRIAPEAIEPPPTLAGGRGAATRGLARVEDGLVVLLDLDRLFAEGSLG